MTELTDPDPSEDAEEAYDRFLEAALRGDLSADAEFVPPADAPPDIRDALLGLRRVIRGDGSAWHQPIPSTDGLPFERLGEFRLIRELGRGGMGVVYLAEQESLGRLVALKVLRPEQAGAIAEARFRREVMTAATLRHDHIVTIYATGVDHDVAWLAMEFLSGTGLDEEIDTARQDGEPLSVQSVVTWIAQIAAALAVAHDGGFIHRDVKPSNIRIRSDDRAVLLDFGLARRVDSQTLTATGSFSGSPFYVSPEQIEARRDEVTHASDIYSLGVTLYEALTGRVPFAAEDPARLFHQILSQEPDPPRQLRADLPVDLETVILHAIEKRPERRYPSAARFAADLEAVLALRPITARPASAATRVVRAIRRHRIMASLFAMILIVATALAAMRGFDQLERDRAFSEQIENAAAATARGDHADALMLLDRALGVRPNDPVAELARHDVEERRRRDEANEIVASARSNLTLLRAGADRRAALEAEVRRFRQEERLRWLPRAERDDYRRSRQELDVETERFERSLIQIENAISEVSGRVDPEEVAVLRAELYSELWKIAVARGDHRAAKEAKMIVAENDSTGIFISEISAGGRLQVSTRPSGVEVHLFRYQPHNDLVAGGDSRLVPVAVRGGEPPVPPGSVVLRAIENLGPVREGDLILTVAGRSVLTHFMANEDGLLDEYLVSIDGKVIESGDYLVLEPFERIKEQQVERLRDVVPTEHRFDRGGESVVRQLRGFSDLDWEVVVAPEAIRRFGGLVGTVYRDGEELEIVLPRDLHTRLSAAPMFLSPATLEGRTPIESVALASGSYLAVLRDSDGNQVRAPFQIERGAVTELDVVLPSISSLPGLTFVPAGSFRAGGDPDALFARPASEPWVDDFWIQDVEVSTSDYAIFLSDPKTREAIERGEAAQLIPRFSDPLRGDPPWTADGTGRYLAPGRKLLPAASVTWFGALAYAEWLNRELGDASDYSYDLPTELEWEKAARGVDGRAFPFGDEIDPTWIRSRYSRVIPITERSNAYPIDESPYGVFDLAGSLYEWTKDPYMRTSKTIKGGAWGLSEIDAFRAAKRGGELPGLSRNQAGFRLVLRRRDQ